MSKCLINKGDAIDWLRDLQDGSVDLIVTDPPYESLEKHRAIGTTTRLKHSKASSNDWFEIFPNSRFEELFSECFRVLKKNRHFYLFCDQETMFVAKPIGERSGFRFWKPLIWDKQKIGMGYHYRCRYELVLFFEKGKRKLNDLSIPDVIQASRIHNGYPAEKPVAISETLIRQSTEINEVVIDPFMGSASVGLAALSLGRSFMGNDLCDEAVRVAESRLSHHIAANGKGAPTSYDRPKKKAKRENMALSKGARRAFDWLKTQRAGTVVSYKDLMEVTEWSEVSLNTYLTKRKLAPFLLKLQGKKLKVLMDGSDISEAFFDETFTQTGPQNITVSPGDVLTGELEKYELVEPLGSGAVAHVWSAESQRSGTLVAAKIMMPTGNLLQESVLPTVRDRFRREARNGKTLNHPNIVRYLDLGQHEKIPFLVMELAQGAVSNRLKDFAQLTESEAGNIVQSSLKGLEYLHGKGSPHRDVKPANMLEFANTIKLGDLGIVKWSDYDPAFTKGGTVTRQSMQLGSWFYMAPEQQQSPHDAIPASDIYALAVTWIELLSGEVPPPQSIGFAAYKLPLINPIITDIIRRMHSYNASERPPISEILQAINTAYGI